MTKHRFFNSFFHWGILQCRNFSYKKWQP